MIKLGHEASPTQPGNGLSQSNTRALTVLVRACVPGAFDADEALYSIVGDGIAEVDTGVDEGEGRLRAMFSCINSIAEAVISANISVAPLSSTPPTALSVRP